MTGSGEQTPEGIRPAQDASGGTHVVAAQESASGRTSVSADAGTGKGGKKSPAKKSAEAAPAKKTAAKKTTAKKTTAKKTANKSSSAAPDKLAVRSGESPWTEAELAEVRELLTAESARLREEISDAEEGIAEMLRDSADAGGEDQADTGSKTFEREHEMSLAASHREILGQTERALTRIDNGTYGICENCGNPIGKARLQAFPRATLCMACKEREERR